MLRRGRSVPRVKEGLNRIAVDGYGNEYRMPFLCEANAKRVPAESVRLRQGQSRRGLGPVVTGQKSKGMCGVRASISILNLSRRKSYGESAFNWYGVLKASLTILEA